MTHKDVKTIADNILKTASCEADCMVDSNLDDFIIYTKFWYIPFEQIEELNKQLKITHIVADGSLIEIHCKKQ